MKIRHQVRQARRGLGKRCGEAIRIPARFRQRHPDGPTLRPLNGGNRQRIGGVIDHDAIPGPVIIRSTSAKPLTAPLTTITSSARVGRPRAV
jgi:hypothetical protein